MCSGSLRSEREVKGLEIKGFELILRTYDSNYDSRTATPRLRESLSHINLLLGKTSPRLPALRIKPRELLSSCTQRAQITALEVGDKLYSAVIEQQGSTWSSCKCCLRNTWVKRHVFFGEVCLALHVISHVLGVPACLLIVIRAALLSPERGLAPRKFPTTFGA